MVAQGAHPQPHRPDQHGSATLRAPRLYLRPAAAAGPPWGERAAPKAPAQAQVQGAGQNAGWQRGACFNCGQAGHRWQDCTAYTGLQLIPPLRRLAASEAPNPNGKGNKGNGKNRNGNGKGQEKGKGKGKQANRQQREEAPAPPDDGADAAGAEAGGRGRGRNRRRNRDQQ